MVACHKDGHGGHKNNNNIAIHILYIQRNIVINEYISFSIN